MKKETAFFEKRENLTDDDDFNNVKKAFEKVPNLIINPNKWKKERLKELKSKGRNWSFKEEK